MSNEASTAIGEVPVLSPSDFVGVTNQLLETALGYIVIEGELSEFRVRKDKWLYFKVKDEHAVVDCFGVVYMLPGPVEDGMKLRVAGQARLHPKFGFSFSVSSISLAGEGTIKKGFELLRQKLSAEGLFDEERKRPIPYPPQEIALITSAEGAAVADFTKVLAARWPYTRVRLIDSLMQGDSAPGSLVEAIDQANQTSAEVLVITRGGGSSEDLAAFNDERVVRAIAASRTPTLVAIGHETDESLSELTSDMRASTPSNAAELLVPDRESERQHLGELQSRLETSLATLISSRREVIQDLKYRLRTSILDVFKWQALELSSLQGRLSGVDPNARLAAGFAAVSSGGKRVQSVKDLGKGDLVELRFKDGQKEARIE